MIRRLWPLALLLTATASQQVPAPPQAGPVALVGATLHPVSGPEIPNGTLVFEAGRITALGPGVPVPKGAQAVDLKGLHVYPALIDAKTEMGLFEIGSIAATKDAREMGEINPNARAEVAVNPDSELIGVTRSNGVALALTVPQGSLLSGTSALLKLDGWTWEEMTFRAPVAMHLAWPRMALGAGTEEELKPAREARDLRLRQLREAFDDARAYRASRRAPAPPPQDRRWEALLPVLEGSLPLVVHAHEAAGIRAAVAFADREGVKMILSGGQGASDCAELLKARDIPVIVEDLLRLPMRRDDPTDAPFTLPERLRAAGVRFCIASGETWNARNLPYHAAMAAAHGLPREEALKAVTLYPAQILGVGESLGSLEAGKDATLMVTTGDPLEPASRVEMLWISGRRVDLTDRQKLLWEKYRKRPAKN